MRRTVVTINIAWFIIRNSIFSQENLFVFYKVLSINNQISLNNTAHSASINGFSSGLYFYVYIFFSMYVPCILYIVLISINNAKYIYFFILTIFMLCTLLHVSIHIYHPQGFPRLYITKVTWLLCY